MTVIRVASPVRATISSDTGINEAADLMLREGAGVIPVVDDGRFAGLLTWTSVLAVALKRGGHRDVA